MTTTKKSPKKGARRRSARAAEATTERTKPFRKWQGAFLEALQQRCTVTEAAVLAGIDRKTAYRARDKDATFAAAWDEAVNQTVEVLEQRLFERAVDGWPEPVFYEGVICGHVQKFSPTLMIFALKCWKPRRYNLAPGDAGEAGSGGREMAAEFGRALGRMFGTVPAPKAAA